jgi:aminopeptidase N
MLCLGAAQRATVWPGKAYQRFKDAGNMTDRFGALAALVHSGHAGRAGAGPLSMPVQATSAGAGQVVCAAGGAPDRDGKVLPAVAADEAPDFNLKNPNRARSLIFSYCSANPGAFHRADAAATCSGATGAGARRLQPAGGRPPGARTGPLEKAGRALPQRAREAITRVAAKADLSNDVREVVTRALAD